MNEILNTLKDKFYKDRNTSEFIRHNKDIWNKKIGKMSNSKILVELCGLQHCIISWSYFANVLAEKTNARICSYGAKTKIENYVMREIYASFNVNEHVTECLSKEDNKRKNEILKLKYSDNYTKQEWFDIEIEGIAIGTEIYESYLIAGNVTLNPKDPILMKFLKEGINKVLFWKRYLQDNQVEAIILSHSCYMGAIIRKVANCYGVKVYQITANWGQSLFEGYNEGGVFKHYREIFNQLTREEQKEGCQWAKKQIEKRFSGAVGVDMWYSKKSSFKFNKNNPPVLEKNNKIKVVICSHCFFDNPHCYGGMLFLDFYEWLCFLGEVSKKTDYDWYLKVHPDYRKGTIERIKSILGKYPDIKLIPENTSHQQLVKENVQFVLTVHGTVGCEYPLMGVQVINAGNNPHVAYDFNWHPKNIKEYEELLYNLDHLHKKIDPNEVYEFYFVHHKYGAYFSEDRSKDDLIFKSNREMIMKLGEKIYTSKMYAYFLAEWTKERHQEIIKNVKSYLKKIDNYKDGKIYNDWK